MPIPKTGLTKEALERRLEAFRARDINWRSGRVFGYVFDPGQEALEIGKNAFATFLTENALDFTVFPSVLRLENELVGIAADLARGDGDVVGNFTSGGTESIILAVKTARDYARERKPGVQRPEMLLPATAHAAFHKAAHYLDVKVVQVPVNPATFKADAALVRKAVGPNTILLVGSAPSYTHGVIDPISELGALAQEKGLLLHVDACMGGFLLPYFRRLGRPVPDFDFRVPGVTSFSMDFHKYAYTPKGASVILYRSKELRKYQIFACAGWTGYTVVNNTIQSTKSGGPMAGAWAILHFIGDDGYLELARKKLEATALIVKGIEGIEELRVMGKPDMCLVGFTSDTLDVFHLIDEMNARGWYIQPALAYGDSKEHIHMSISASNVAWVDAFLDDLRDCVTKVKTMPPGNLAQTIKESLSDEKTADLSDADFSGMLELAGIKDGALPEKMADVNGVLNALPVDFRERLLTAFVNDVFRPIRGG